MNPEPISGLSDAERHLLMVSLDIHREQMRAACLEDQGTPDGKPGTVGAEVQGRIAALRQRLERRT